MKKWVDKKRHPLDFCVGDQVLIKLKTEQIRFRGHKDQCFIRKYEAPVKVLKKIGNASYRVMLSAWMKIHPVHVSNLKPYLQDLDDKQRNDDVRPSVDLKQKEDKQVKEIIVDRERKGSRPTRRIHEFLVDNL